MCKYSFEKVKKGDQKSHPPNNKDTKTRKVIAHLDPITDERDPQYNEAHIFESRRQYASCAVLQCAQLVHIALLRA